MTWDPRSGSRYQLRLLNGCPERVCHPERVARDYACRIELHCAEIGRSVQRITPVYDANHDRHVSPVFARFNYWRFPDSEVKRRRIEIFDQTAKNPIDHR